jgi:hypothetical protein
MGRTEQVDRPVLGRYWIRVSTGSISTLPPKTRVLPEKLIIALLEFYGTRRLITMLTRARHFALS